MFTQSQREAALSLLSTPHLQEKQCPSPESCLPEAPNQDPGRRRSVGAQVLMTCDPKVFKLESPTWQKIRKEKGSTSLTLLSDQSIWIKYYHCDLAWSSNQCGLFAQLFCCNASSMSSCVGIWSRIYIILPLRLTSSAATLSKRCCGFQATAVTGLPRSQSTVLIVFLCAYLLFARCTSRSHLS